MSTDVTSVSLLLILAVLVVILNCTCFFILCKSPSLRKASSFTIGSLLLTHILQGVFVIPMYAAKRWDIDDIRIKGITCDIFRFSYLLTNYTSLLTLVIIGIDRACSVFIPMKYHSVITWRRMALSVLLVWIYTTGLCSIPFNPGLGKVCSYLPSKEWTTAMLLANTLVPFIILSICYTYIYIKTKRIFSKNISAPIVDKTWNTTCKPDDRTVSKPTKQQKDEAMATRMSFIIVFVYFLCWGPSFFYYLLLSLCKTCFPVDYDDSVTEKAIGLIIKVLTFVDALASPILYCWKHRGFRKVLLKYLGHRNKVSTHSAIHDT